MREDGSGTVSAYLVAKGACRTWKVKMCASKACADAGDQGEDACKPGVCGVWCYLCCILLSIAGQWEVGVRRVPSFLGFAIHQED